MPQRGVALHQSTQLGRKQAGWIFGLTVPLFWPHSMEPAEPSAVALSCPGFPQHSCIFMGPCSDCAILRYRSSGTLPVKSFQLRLTSSARDLPQASRSCNPHSTCTHLHLHTPPPCRSPVPLRAHCSGPPELVRVENGLLLPYVPLCTQHSTRLLGMLRKY